MPVKLDNLPAINALRDIRHNWDIHDAWRTVNPNDKSFTYRANANGTQIKSRLDRIYVSWQLSPLTFNWKITPSPAPTDHWLVTVKYAPRDAPYIGKGRWTLPIQTLQNKDLIKEIISRGLKLQTDIEKLRQDQIERATSNIQSLWEEFKIDIKKLTKIEMKKTHHKINSRTKALEKDMRHLRNNPNAENDDNIRANEALLARELEHLERKRAKNRKETLDATLACQNEKLGGAWSALSKERKPRNLIRRFKIPNTNPPQYERDTRKMAELARDFHDNLQRDDPGCTNQLDLQVRTNLIMNEIPDEQLLPEPTNSALNWPLTEAQIEKALHSTKNASATGMDGCPYELWKTLKTQYETDTQKGKQGFNITKVLTELFQDIQTFDVDQKTNFAQGWMCPIYKKKDPTEISNYRPITLLNTDYKLLTKVLAIQLMDHINSLIHEDQAGFIPRRSIFNHIRLAKAIINYAEIMDEDGAIIALDQEKAYDKIRHDYLWETLKAFNLPDQFIKTIKSLYLNATTRVAINGILSKPFKVTRGIRQGDPISCSIFDLGIEPLACMIRKDVNIQGITIPGLDRPIKVNLFADDTNLFLSRNDSFDYAQGVLSDWCQISGAKFNIEKTEIIPIGAIEHRQRIAQTRKINPLDIIPLDASIKIAQEGEAVRSLGAWIGNNTRDITPWEPLVDNIQKALERWRRTHPTMKGRKTIAQAIVGGHTQFLTKAQGMPRHIESTLTKIIREFMWEDDSSPRIALDILQRPVEEGGLNLIDLKARNEAIDIVWLKEYLNFSPTRPTWALVTDAIIDAAAPPRLNNKARVNAFLQTWNPPTSGPRAELINNDTIRMIKMARKHKANLAAIRLTPNLRAQLPAWYHLDSAPRPINNSASRCMLERHPSSKVSDLTRMTKRLRHRNPDSPHDPTPQCVCRDCVSDRLEGCRDPNACAHEALTRLKLITPKLNPLTRERHGTLSLTRRRKERNEIAKNTNGEILFDPSFTCKNNLAECYRIFTNPDRITNIPAKRLHSHGISLRRQEILVYTDGACFHNGKANAKCGSGIWIAPNHVWNRALKVPGNTQSNQVGEIAAVIVAANTVPRSWPMKILTDSKYVIEGLTTNLKDWEDRGWINVKNAKIFKRAAYLLKRRTATTTFQWIKGHNGDVGNEESDRLAKEGANKIEPDALDLDIPKDFDLQGAKLTALTQATAYKGIQERKAPYTRQTTTRNLQMTREAITEYNGEIETDETLWRSIHKPVFSSKFRQFLYKSMHGTQKIGQYWANIPGYEERQTCHSCGATETMDHILTKCNQSARIIIWDLAKLHWQQTNRPWPEISLGLILGCGAITNLHPPPQQTPAGNPQLRSNEKGPIRLIQILIAESAHLIWATRCERVIQERTNNPPEITSKWYRAINKRLIEDKIIATKIKRSASAIQQVKHTWEDILKKEGELPNDWIYNSEVLVGMRTRDAQFIGRP
jgi:ribonuclease HI